MQRPTSSSRASDDRHHHVIDIMEQPQGPTSLPHFERSSGGGGRRAAAAQSIWRSKKWINAVPVILVLCLFILWWFSYPVNLEFKDGRTIGLHRINMLQLLNDTHVDHTMLASATPPNATIPQILEQNNETEAQVVTGESY